MSNSTSQIPRLGKQHQVFLGILAAWAVLFIGAVSWLALPELSLASTGIQTIFTLIGFAGVVIFLLSSESYGKSSQDLFCNKIIGIASVSFASIGLLLLFYYALASFAGSFNDSQAQRYAQLIGEIKQESTENLPTLDIEKLALVPGSIARNRASKKLSEQNVATIGSQYEVREMYKQIVNGELRWVGILEPRGFMRWLLEEGSPGYVSVSAIDENDAVLVTELDGKPVNITRGKGFYNTEDVDRAFWLHGFGSDYLFSATTEIDDQGKPYWVAAVGSREVSNNGVVVTEVLLMDAQSGKINRHKVDEVPSWVDRVFPAELVEKNLVAYGEYSQGAWNFADEGKMAFENMDLVYDQEGSAHYIASVASYNNSSTGLFAFMTVDAQTGKAAYFPFTAVEESEASRAILGTLPKGQLDFAITDIRPYLVNGIPTYVGMAYTGVGANKHYAFSAIDNPQRLAVKTSVQAAYQAYLALPAGPVSLAINQEQSLEEITAVVQRIAPVGKGYQVLLEGDDTIFNADAEILIELGLTKPGDRIKVRVNKGNAYQGAILELDNLEFGPSLKTESANSQS